MSYGFHTLAREISGSEGSWDRKKSDLFSDDDVQQVSRPPVRRAQDERVPAFLQVDIAGRGPVRRVASVLIHDDLVALLDAGRAGTAHLKVGLLLNDRVDSSRQPGGFLRGRSQ